MSKQGFKKDSSTTDFEMYAVDDTCIVNLDPVKSEKADKAKAEEIFNALYDIYIRFYTVLGKTTTVQDLSECIQVFHNYFMK